MVSFKVNFIEKHPTLKNLLHPYLISGAEEIEIAMSNGYPWNAWVTVYDIKGKKILSTFDSGFYWRLMIELKNIHGFKMFAKRQLKMIEREWKEFIA